jgi:hypothetical protein
MELPDLVSLCVIDTTLKDATTMFMSCDLNAILGNGIIDELIISKRNLSYT